MSYELKDYLNAINFTKKNLMDSEDKLWQKKYPNPKAFLRGKSDDQEKLLKPLGMVHVRTQRLRRMSEDFLKWDYKDATDLYGIGKYGSDSYRIFYKNEVPKDVEDKELKRYINEL